MSEIVKPCTYCGQMLALESEADQPEMLCKCPEAMEA